MASLTSLMVRISSRVLQLLLVPICLLAWVRQFTKIKTFRKIWNQISPLHNHSPICVSIHICPILVIMTPQAPRSGHICPILVIMTPLAPRLGHTCPIHVIMTLLGQHWRIPKPRRWTRTNLVVFELTFPEFRCYLLNYHYNISRIVYMFFVNALCLLFLLNTT